MSEKAKILLVDDEPQLVKVIKMRLEGAGYSVLVARTGEEALKQVKEGNPDLIILDVRMPRMTGYEACRQLKDNPATSGIPIVFLSAKGQETEIEQGLASGAVEYIVKPFAPDELTSQVREILRRIEASE